MAVGDTLAVPDTAFVPDQPPAAVHEVAFVEDHVSVALDPEVIDVGFAAKVTVGATGAGVTLTVADREAAPPVPVHEST